jgi:hypothetical protein
MEKYITRINGICSPGDSKMKHEWASIILFLLIVSIVFVSPIQFASGETSSIAVLGRYTLYDSNFTMVFNWTVKALRDIGFDISGDASWPISVNYTFLCYTYKYKIVQLSLPEVMIQLTEGKHDWNVTAFRIMDNGTIGERLGSFLRHDQPARVKFWESQHPAFGIGFDPDVLALGNSFVIDGVTYTVNRTETLKDTIWGENETRVLHGYQNNETYIYEHWAWCDAKSGIILKQTFSSENPATFGTVHEEHRLIETGIELKESEPLRFDVKYRDRIHWVFINTNSTLSNFIFDVSRSMINLTVYGSENTHGICNVTIPKTLVTSESGFEVYLDGQRKNYTIAEDASNYYVWIEYQHSSHTIAIAFLPSALWLQWWFWLIVICISLAAVGATLLLKRRQAQKSHPKIKINNNTNRFSP